VAIRKLFYSIVPLSNSFREGEIKGVNKNSAPLTQLTPFPLFLEKRRAIRIIFSYCSPSLTLLERGNKKGVSKNSASLTQSTNCRWWLFTLSPFGA